jgi:hypothetical protein
MRDEITMTVTSMSEMLPEIDMLPSEKCNIQVVEEELRGNETASTCFILPCRH